MEIHVVSAHEGKKTFKCEQYDKSFYDNKFMSKRTDFSKEPINVTKTNELKNSSSSLEFCNQINKQA